MTWSQLRQFIIKLVPQNADDAFKIDVDTSLLSGGDNLFELYDIPDNVKRIQMNAAGFLIINEEYAIPAADGTAGQVLTTDGAGNVTFQTPGGGGGGSVWTPPKVGLQDYYNLGRTAPAAAPGASGVRYVFFGANTTGPGSVTNPRIEFTKYMGQDDGNDYDGSALSFRIHYQLFNTTPSAGTDNVRWNCQITFIEEGTDNINLAQLQSPFIDMNVSGKTPNIGYTEVLTPLLNTGSATGVRGIRVTLTRLNSDAADTYTSDVDFLGIEILN
jgi:hypothetical protein